MKRIFSLLCCTAFSVVVSAQMSSNIPVIQGKMESYVANEKIVEKEPKVHFTSPEEKVYSVCNGIIRMVSNFNVVVEANGVYYLYQDVKGNPEQVNKEVKRGEQIGTMYFNEEKKTYSLYIGILKGPKQFMTHEEVVKMLRN